MNNMASLKRTQEELLAELRSRFGDDPMDWAFQCPACKDIATGRDFREAIATDPARYGIYASKYLGRICIGRLLGALSKTLKYTGRGCDWSASGLFRGPEFVILPDGSEAPSFAPAPVATGDR